ncbi:MAG: GntR family transcriptional regulator [Clostridia bacterium]|nr:GntR family transcriptional regulator [Clostridia bacterium]
MIQHKTVSLADQVFEKLETDILSGKYKKGELLVENRLSSELGVSRTPIREALRRLEQEHIIEETGKGSMVLGITERDLEDIFLIRKNIECIATAFAAERRTEEQLKELKEILELQQFYLEKRDTEQIKQMDSKFHYMIYELCGSTAFYDTLVPLHKKIQKYRRISIEKGSRAEQSVGEHKKIFEAIAAGDKVGAKKASFEHIQNAYAHIKKG